jgi:hypothetical protein
MSTALPSELTQKDLENETFTQLKNSGINFYIIVGFKEFIVHFFDFLVCWKSRNWPIYERNYR